MTVGLGEAVERWWLWLNGERVQTDKPLSSHYTAQLMEIAGGYPLGGVDIENAILS